MSRATLKKYLGEAGAGLDDAGGGNDTLLDVLQALAASSGETIGYSQATPTVGIKGALVCDTPSRLANVYMKADVAGTAGTTTVAVLVNNVSKATLSVDNAEVDGTYKGLAIGLALEAGDKVELSVTAVGTGATGLSATVRLKPVTVEA